MNNCSVFFASSATLRLCVNCCHSSGDFSQLQRVGTQVGARHGMPLRGLIHSFPCRGLPFSACSAG